MNECFFQKACSSCSQSTRSMKLSAVCVWEFSDSVGRKKTYWRLFTMDNTLSSRLQDMLQTLIFWDGIWVYCVSRQWCMLKTWQSWTDGGKKNVSAQFPLFERSCQGWGMLPKNKGDIFFLLKKNLKGRLSQESDWSFSLQCVPNASQGKSQHIVFSARS